MEKLLGFAPHSGKGVSRVPAQEAGGLARDLEMTEDDFARIARLIYQRAGIVLARHKREMVYSRLSRRLRLHGLTRFSDYLAMLEGGRASGAKDEWPAFINALTTNLTAFFREPHHFTLLSHFLEQRLQARGGKLRIWCAAASTGEEPYSIAMVLREVLGAAADLVELIATDIDTDALNEAEAGVYPLERIAKLGDERCKRFLLRGSGRREGLVRVKPEIRRLVRYRQLNLLDAQWGLGNGFDAIFCRNVMIYFDKATQSRLLDRFALMLKPDGLLFAGHSENFSWLNDAFTLRGQTVYTLSERKRAEIFTHDGKPLSSG